MYPKIKYKNICVNLLPAAVEKQTSASLRLRVSLILCALCVLCGLTGCAETPATDDDDLLFPPARYSNLPAKDNAAAPSDRVLESEWLAQTASISPTRNHGHVEHKNTSTSVPSVSSVVQSESRGGAEARRSIS